MKSALIVLFCISGTVSALAGEGDPVVDRKLFKSLKARYNGQWIGGMQGNVAAESLKDRSLLIEASGRMAEFAFYNIPKAVDSFLYVPPTITSGWLNYHDRSGASILCGQSSYDLKNNPFPNFKCRFTVDSQGVVRSFMDRSASTSNAKPGGYDGWESNTRDFHWRGLEELKASAGAESDFQARRYSGGKESFRFRIHGEVAAALYAKLDVPVEMERRGPYQVSLKHGKQISCVTYDQDGGLSCDVAFGFDGVARAPSRD